MSVFGKLIGWRRPESRLDYAQWIITAIAAAGLLLFVAGRNAVAIVCAGLAAAGMVVVMRRRPITAAMTAVAAIGALPALAVVLLVPAWQGTFEQSVMVLWAALGLFPALAAGLVTVDNRPLQAAKATAPMIAGTIFTAVTGPAAASFTMPVALTVSVLLLVRAQSAATVLLGDPVGDAAGWIALGPLLVPDYRGTRPVGYSDGSWLVVAWPGAGAQPGSVLARTARIADYAGLAREAVQAVQVTDGQRIERVETPRGVLARVPRADVTDFCGALPARRRMSRGQRAALRLHCGDVEAQDEVGAV